MGDQGLPNQGEQVEQAQMAAATLPNKLEAKEMRAPLPPEALTQGTGSKKDVKEQRVGIFNDLLSQRTVATKISKPVSGKSKSK